MTEIILLSGIHQFTICLKGQRKPPNAAVNLVFWTKFYPDISSVQVIGLTARENMIGNVEFNLLLKSITTQIHLPVSFKIAYSLKL
jgi:hypothetical protein